MTTNQPKTYDQALKESFAKYVAKTPGQSAYMKMDFDAGFSAGYNAAHHDRERELRERAAIAAMQGILSNQSMTAAMSVTIQSETAMQCLELPSEMDSKLAIVATAKLAINYANNLVKELNRKDHE